MTIPLRFKGKRANKKFGRYGKRGGNRKLNYNRPPEHRMATNSEQGIFAITHVSVMSVLVA